MLQEKMVVHRFAHQAMGTTFEAILTGCDISYARQAAHAVFSEVDRLERLFSRFISTSEISQINRLKPGITLRIGVETYECLTLAEKIRRETAGAFDINFRAQQKSRPEENEKSPRLIFSSSGGFSIAWPRESSTLDSGHLSLDLDLGGIGKGYALDSAAEVLAPWEIDRFLFHAGTSTALARGDAPELNPEEHGWPVGAGASSPHAVTPKRLLLKNRALSGSGTELKGQHIIDPRRGQPADRYLAVWVSHPRAAEADALSTAFMVMSLEEIESYCRVHREVWALVLTLDQTHHVFNPGIFV